MKDDWLDQLFDDLVASLPIKATEIGWEKIGEDVVEAKAAITQRFEAEVLRGKIEELKKAEAAGYAEEFDTYDYKRIAEYVLERISVLEGLLGASAKPVMAKQSKDSKPLTEAPTLRLELAKILEKYRKFTLRYDAKAKGSSHFKPGEMADYIRTSEAIEALLEDQMIAYQKQLLEDYEADVESRVIAVLGGQTGADLSRSAETARPSHNQVDTLLEASVPYKLELGGIYLVEVKEYALSRKVAQLITTYYHDVHDISIQFVFTAGRGFALQAVPAVRAEVSDMQPTTPKSQDKGHAKAQSARSETAK